MRHTSDVWQLLAELSDEVKLQLADGNAIHANPQAALVAAAHLERLARMLAEQAAVSAVASGLSWTDIGAAYGISKQAAHQRFARHVRRFGSDRSS
jgi:hypothetical protein